MSMAECGSSFLRDLSSRAPTPGGGSASAYVGAIGAALCGMVGRLNDKKDGTPGKLHDTIEAADGLLDRLSALVREDVEAFSGLMDAWRLPDDDPNKATEMEKRTIAATETPLTIMATAFDVMKLARVGLERSKTNCLSDAGVAAFVAHAALEGARLNVMINLPGITDERKRAELRGAADTLRAEARALRVGIDKIVDERYS
ncbi:MAG: cyclodeaminase/cyclohydrolase family protein [Phycisphaerae bacterium]|nr:cyclodeaminase/cyclohydrolase family protein [Phycisphaerae bacterium]